MAPTKGKRFIVVIVSGLMLYLLYQLVVVPIVMLFFGSWIDADHWLISLVLGIFAAVLSWLFSRQLGAASIKQAFSDGFIWAIMLAAIFMIFVKRNDSLNLLFGNWSTYLIFIGVLVGPVLMKPRPLQSGISNTNNQFKN